MIGICQRKTLTWQMKYFGTYKIVTIREKEISTQVTEKELLETIQPAKLNGKKRRKKKKKAGNESEVISTTCKQEEETVPGEEAKAGKKKRKKRKKKQSALIEGSKFEEDMSSRILINANPLPEEIKEVKKPKEAPKAPVTLLT